MPPRVLILEIFKVIFTFNSFRAEVPFRHSTPGLQARRGLFTLRHFVAIVSERIYNRLSHSNTLKIAMGTSD
jgi:hypothetical protein